ncbi:MAG: 16S rRNA (cytidine(1402)-2'-O)-methyltransferase [Anaerorhabdus sp.]
MHHQKSFDNDKSTLFIVPTPIGNLSEVSERVIDTLKMVDYIACEDTRVTGKLLNLLNIENRMIQHHKYNEKESTIGIIALLEKGCNVALVSDAGYPLISDPGQDLVKRVTDEGFNVVPISGCSAVLNAVVASGCIVSPFTFIGFLPSSDTSCKKALEQYKDYDMTLVFYESPHRIVKMLNSLLEIFGDRNIALCKELTKKHEEFYRGKCSEVINSLENIKGELVVVVDPKEKSDHLEINLGDITFLVEKRMQNGMSKSDAIKDVSKSLGISKNEIYNHLHNIEVHN